jgi:hypothetical protein
MDGKFKISLGHPCSCSYLGTLINLLANLFKKAIISYVGQYSPRYSATCTKFTFPAVSQFLPHLKKRVTILGAAFTSDLGLVFCNKATYLRIM